MTRLHRTAMTALALGACAQAAPPPPCLSFPDSQEWTLHYEVDVHSPRQHLYLDVNGNRYLPNTPQFQFQSAEVYFPAIESTSFSTTDLLNWNFKAKVLWENVLVDEAPTLIPGTLSTGRYLRLRLPASQGDYVGDQLRLMVDIPMVCRETRLDETLANAIGWPANPWPDDLAECLKPQLFIESQSAEIAALVQEWTGGKSRGAPPARLAKFLAGKVVELIQPAGDGYLHNSSGFTQGFRVQGAAATARSPRPAGQDLGPTTYDMTCLYVAVCRAAGLPARLVIGLDPIEGDKRKAAFFRSWAEICLLDESIPPPANLRPGEKWPGRVEWIPVSVARQREFSSRAPPIDQKWDFFGNNETSDDLIPIAFQFHPPAAATFAQPQLPTPGAPGAPIGSPPKGQTSMTPVVAYGAYSLWGWSPSPAVPALDQQIRAWGQHTVRRGGEK